MNKFALYKKTLQLLKQAAIPEAYKGSLATRLGYYLDPSIAERQKSIADRQHQYELAASQGDVSRLASQLLPPGTRDLGNYANDAELRRQYQNRQIDWPTVHGKRINKERGLNWYTAAPQSTDTRDFLRYKNPHAYDATIRAGKAVADTYNKGKAAVTNAANNAKDAVNKGYNKAKDTVNQGYNKVKGWFGK